MKKTSGPAIEGRIDARVDILEGLCTKETQALCSPRQMGLREGIERANSSTEGVGVLLRRCRGGGD